MIKVQGKLILKRGKEQSAQRYHPWIFSGAVHRIEGDLKDGDWVSVEDHKSNVFGYGHFQKGSITVRLLSFSPTAPDKEFYADKIQNAYRLRENILTSKPQTNAYRLIHGEGDGLPGLIVDFYDGVAIVQAHSSGMHVDRHIIAEALHKVMKNSLKAVYYRSQGTLPGVLRSSSEGEYLLGECAVPHIIHEYGSRFMVDWEGGQKTGFFLDQRENRRLLGTMVKGKKVLNTFCYTGGFSVYALHGEATLVHSVDVSEKAIGMTRKNIQLNGFDAALHTCFAADTFDFFKEQPERYDVIVLDPPAFAKHRDAKHQAMKGYQRLNAEAMRIIQPGGIIFTFSCSQVVDRQLFYNTVVSSAIQAGRDIKVLEHLSQPADHPVSIFHPEGEYLKGLVLYVA